MEITYLTGIPVIMGLTEIVKKVGMDNQLLPVFNLFIGVVWSLFFFSPTEAVLQGVVLGLTAAGLFRSTKVITGRD